MEYHLHKFSKYQWKLANALLKINLAAHNTWVSSPLNKGNKQPSSEAGFLLTHWKAFILFPELDLNKVTTPLFLSLKASEMGVFKQGPPCKWLDCILFLSLFKSRVLLRVGGAKFPPSGCKQNACSELQIFEKNFSNLPQHSTFLSSPRLAGCQRGRHKLHEH